MTETIICDKCGQEFKPGTVSRHVIDPWNYVNITYFQHYACGQRYIINVTDPELEKLIAIRKKQEELIDVSLKAGFPDNEIEKLRKVLRKFRKNVEDREKMLTEKYKQEIRKFAGGGEE